MNLRVARYRTRPEDADSVASRAHAMLARVRRSDGLLWSAVGRRSDVAGIVVVSVSVWRDRTAMDAVLGAGPGGGVFATGTPAEMRHGLPIPESVDIAEVVDTAGLAAVARQPPTQLRRQRPLLPQDRQLLRLLCGGATLAEAASNLGVSVGTAKNRRHEIYEKLGVHDLAHACELVGAELGAEAV
jgi:DNA-binding NarL/FixJ family response regulator